MINHLYLPDDVVLNIMRNLEVKDALALNESLKNRFSPLPRILWEFYLNRDFPQAAPPIDRNFQSAYENELTLLNNHVALLTENIGKIVNFEWSENLLDETVQCKLLVQKLTVLSKRLLEDNTISELTLLRSQFFVALTSESLATDYQRTPLHYAAIENDHKLLELLIAANVNINKTDEWRQTALNLSSGHGHVDAVKLLLAANADPNIEDLQHETALFKAVRRGSAEVIGLLLAAGANVHTVNVEGYGPYALALRLDLMSPPGDIAKCFERKIEEYKSVCKMF